MKIAPFALERFFARYEFNTRYTLSTSDCEPLALADLLALADSKTRAMWDNLVLGYTESPGHPLLREAIAELYPGLEPDDVLVCAPQEGIFLLMHTLLAPGDHVVCTFPGYQSLYAVAASMGCEVSRWQPVEDQGWRFDLTQLDGLLRKNTRLVVVNFPHNPTGSLPSAEEFAAMVETLTARGIYLLSDEMYRFLELDRHAPLPAGCELYEHGVSLGGLSKSFGLPGLRMGWTATRDRELLAGMAQLKDYTTICSSAPSEILALIALGARRQIVADQKARLQRNLRALQELLESRGGRHLRVNLPAGGSLCFARLPGLEDTAPFCQDVIRETGILLAPGELFEYGHQHVRIGFGREDFPEVLGRFAEFLGRHME